MLDMNLLKKHAFAAFDLDGTLINDENQVYDQVFEGLQYLKSIGLQLIIATGRTINALNSLKLNDKYLDLFVNQIILNDGNVIYNRTNGMYQVINSIPFEYFEEIHSWNEREIDFVIEMNGCHYANTKEAALKYANVFKTNRKYIRISQLGLFEFSEITEIALFPRKKNNMIDSKIFTDLHVKYTSLYDTTLLLPKRTCKGTGLLKALKDKEIGLDKVIAFGNGKNDITMFNKCNTSVAVKNSEKDLAKIATFQLRHEIGPYLLTL